MNQKVLAILVALCVIAGSCALWYYRNPGSASHTAKPISTTSMETAGHGSQPVAASTGAGLATRKVAGKPHQSAMPAEFADDQSSATPEALQAFALKLDDDAGVAHLVSPRVPVDVLVSAHPPGSDAKQGSVTKTVLRNIQVLSAAAYAQQNPDGKSQQIEVVNLLLTPEQAMTLSQTGVPSDILLVLRNPEGGQVLELPATALSDSIQDRQPLADKPGRRISTERDISRGSYYTVQVINGSRTSESKISTVVFPIPEGAQ